MEDNTIKLDLSQFGKQEESPAPTVGEASPEPVSGDHKLNYQEIKLNQQLQQLLKTKPETM